MAVSTAFLINMLRNVTGRVDPQDPLFTDAIMLQYLNNFLTLESTQDIRIFKNKVWWVFNYSPTDANPLPVDLNNLFGTGQKVSTIEPPSYCAGFELFWYQNPAEFYRIWPETQSYTPSRPTYVLYYNNELTFRNPPDQTYEIKIAAYQFEIELSENGLLQSDYLYRYAVYGAALDIFSDFGEMDKYNEIFPVYRRHRAMVYSRTYCQYQNQRPAPEF